jgi:hypothetical protein
MFLPSGKEVLQLLAMPHKAHLVAIIDPDKATLVDIRGSNTAKAVRTIQKWGGSCTKDGRYGLYSPTRYVLPLRLLLSNSNCWGVLCIFSLFSFFNFYFHFI